MPSDDRISPRQLAALGFVLVLPPLIRRVPGRTVAQAGAAAWLSVLPAAAVLALLLCFLLRALRGELGALGLGRVIIFAAGERLGRALLAILVLWLCFFAGFLLRSDADRFITTVYPESGAAVFILTMLAACIPAALGSVKALARSAMLFRALLLLVLAAVLLLALPGLSLGGLLRPEPDAAEGILTGSLSIINPLCCFGYLALLSDRVKPGLRASRAFGWLGAALVLAELLCLVTVGTLGAELSAKLHNPFFALARCVSFFGAVVHIEAAVVSVWVFSDFVLVSTLLLLASRLLALVFAKPPAAENPARTRWLTAPCALLALATALLIAPESADLRPFSDVIIPLANLALNLAVIPALLLLARSKLRRLGPGRAAAFKK